MRHLHVQHDGLSSSIAADLLVLRCRNDLYSILVAPTAAAGIIAFECEGSDQYHPGTVAVSRGFKQEPTIDD